MLWSVITYLFLREKEQHRETGISLWSRVHPPSLSRPTSPVLLKDAVQVDLEHSHRNAAGQLVHGFPIHLRIELKLRKVFGVFDSDDLIHQEGRLPVRLLVGDLQETPHVLRVEGAQVLREEVVEKALDRVPHLRVLTGKDRLKLCGSRQRLQGCYGNVAQTRALTAKLKGEYET